MGIKGGYGMVEGERGSKLRNEDMDADVKDNHPIAVVLLDRRQLDWSWIHPSLLRTGSEAPMDWIRAVWSSWSSEAL